ncbi:MAG: hypothetical protein AB1726_09040, partial [Planctomycetota bacterium]
CLAAFAAAAARLERAGGAADLLERADLLAAAERAAGEAAARRASGEILAAAWLAAPGPDGVVPDRLAALDRALADQRRTLADARAALAAALEARWAALLAAAADAVPGDVVPIARWFADGRLALFLTHLADRLREAAETSAGDLDLAGLEGFAHLAAWAAIAAEEPLAATPAGRAIRLFAIAREWPAGGSEADPPAIDSSAPWAEELLLRLALAGPASPLPGPPGTLAVYRSTTPEGSVTWQVDRVLPDPDPPAGSTWSRIVEERYHDASGRPLGERRLRLVQQEKRFFEEGVRRVEILDLSRLDQRFAMAAWTAPAGGDLPPVLGVGAADLALFRRRRAEAGAEPCLVRRRGAAATWYSASLGLVRHEDPGRIVRELCFASRPDQ